MDCYNEFIVDTKKLKNNVRNIRKLIGSDTKLCAVVKANAYGLGIETVVNSISNYVDFFAVACLKEALKIRVFNKTAKILILGIVDKSSYVVCANNNISISVSNLQQVEECINIKNLNIHIQVNTGLNRFGFRSIFEFKKAVKLINLSNNCRLEGVYSHFATKKNDVKFINRQYFKFLQFKKVIKDNSIIFHIANSFATLLDSSYRCNMVRNGFLIYGGTNNNIGNYPILTLKSKIINIFVAKKGDTIGYDRTYKVNKSMKIAVVSMGYADGLDRRLSNNFSVLINGKYCKIIGLICMDVFMVDVSNIKVSFGDEVVILGKQKRNEITLYDYAEVLNTSPYEILLKFNYKRMNYIVK